jgi:hypothetical protein
LTLFCDFAGGRDARRLVLFLVSISLGIGHLLMVPVAQEVASRHKGNEFPDNPGGHLQ